MALPETISGLGSRSSVIHAVADAQRRGLSGEEARLVGVVGAGITVGDAIRGSGMPEPRAIAVLLSLRLRGIINPGPMRAAAVPGAAQIPGTPPRAIPPVPPVSAVRSVPGGVPRPRPVAGRPTSPAFTPVPAPVAPIGSNGFDSGALEERIDLERERKREILEAEARCASEDHFAVLGLAPGADGAAAKKAFYELSRRFHPDRFFGRELGTFKGRIERIFRRLNEAQAALSDPERRRAWLAEHPQFAGAAAAASRPAAAPGPNPAPAPAGPRSASPPAGPRPVPAPTAPTPAPAAAAPPPPRSPKEEARAAERRARLARHPFMAKHARVHEAVAKARKLIEQGEFSRALSELGLAGQIDPNNPAIADLMAAAKRGEDTNKAEADYRAAKAAETLGDYEKAIGLLRGAVALAPDRASWEHHLASLLLRRGGEAELKEAHPHARRAAELAPDDVQVRLTFAEVLQRAGLGKNALREYEAILKLRPDEPTARERLRGLKWKL